MANSRLQRKPSPAAYSDNKLIKPNEAAKTKDMNNVFSDRLLNLLTTKIKNPEVLKIPAVQELMEVYKMDNASLADLMHFVQIIRALDGDTRAYLAVTKVLETSSIQNRQQEKDEESPLKILENIMVNAFKKANEGQVVDAEFDETDEQGIITIEIEPHKTREDSDE